MLSPRKFFQHSSSPFISQHQITTIFFQEIRVIFSNHACCHTYELTPVDDGPLLQSLLITVKSPTIALLLPSVNCCSDKRISQIFSSKLFNSWSSIKIFCIQANFFLNFAGISTWYFFGRWYVFSISFSAYASFAEVIFSIAEVRTLVIWIPSVSSLLCDFFLKYARHFSLFIVFFSS